MATMQGYISGQESQLDELPSWKRDLILRKRANVRMHGGFGLPTPTPSMAGRGRGLLSGQPLSSSLSGPPPCSVRGPHLPLLRSVSVPTSSSHPCQSVNNAVSSRLEVGVVTSVAGVGCSDSNVAQKCVLKSEIASANVSSSMHHKGLNDEGPRVTSPTYSCFSDSCANNMQEMEKDEDFSYGPGIVSKLKNRYMSLAMRDSRSRPPLRKFSSLEDLLDEPRETWQERSSNVAKPRHGHPPHRAQANTAASHHRREVMKRARSVDSLSTRLSEENNRSRGLPKSKSATSRLQSSLSALQKDDVIIIETTKPKSEPQQVNGAPTKAPSSAETLPLTRKMSSSNILEEDEMPPPDTVRHVKKIFEPIGGRARGTKARVMAHKAAQAAANNKTNGVSVPTAKPAIKAKPTDIPPRKTTPPTPALPLTIEEAKSSLKQVAQVSRASPRATLSVRASSALNGDVGDGEESGVGGYSGVSVGGRARPGLTPVTASVTAPLVNGGELRHSVESNTATAVEEGVRKVSNTAVTNIRKESQCQEFNFTRASTQSLSKSSSSTSTKPSSPTPTPLPASPVVSHRVPPTLSSQESLPPHLSTSPSSKLTSKSQESQRVQQENLKNAEKSRGGTDTTHSRFDPLKTSKVEPIKSPSKNVPPSTTTLHQVESSSKVESPRSSPSAPGRGSSSKGSEFPQSVVLSTVDSKTSTSLGSDDLGRSTAKGNLVEAFNKQSAEGISGVLKSSANRDWRNQSANTQVFNFTSSKSAAPDHIENDGLDLSKRTPEQLGSGYVFMPGWEGPRDSSTDGDDLDDPSLDYLDARPGVIPPPSGIVFEGEAVIINGRSNLQRQPKTKKLTISFDGSVQTYEYPSEASLIEDNLPINAVSPSGLTSSADSSSATHGGLASYTPSKIQIGSSFELGVSRTAPTVQTSPPTPPVQSERVEEEYLRPADESETVTWSSERTSDMLF